MWRALSGASLTPEGIRRREYLRSGKLYRIELSDVIPLMESE